MKKISIIVSFYNEEQVLRRLTEEICAVIDQEPENFELVFVNDRSQDRSMEILQQCAPQMKKAKMIIVNMSRRFGGEECFLAGLEHCTGDAIIFMYADLQDPPATIPAMLQLWREGAEIVHTQRRKRIGDHPLKVLAAFWASRLIKNLSDIPIPEDCGDFKLISHRVANHLLSLSENHLHLRGLIPWLGFKQNVVMYDMPPRTMGQSKVPLFGRRAWTAFTFGLTSFSDTPLYAIFIVGFLGTVLSLILVILWAILALSGCPTSGGNYIFMLFLWGTVLTAIGIVGVYMSQICADVRRRPRYIVDNLWKSTA